MPPVKSSKLRSASANAVGSSVAIWVALWTTRPGPDVLIVPVKFCSVTSWAMPLLDWKLTTSLPKPMSIAPRMREPGSSVSLSAPSPSRIAVPPRPMMVPALAMVEEPSAKMPMPPEIVPELKLFTVAVSARMPTPPAPAAIVPKLLMVAVVAKIPKPPAPPEIVPKLVTLTETPLMPATPPEIAPRLLTVPSLKTRPF
jgi:hypothetical protein